jgi:hypothetical protein
MLLDAIGKRLFLAPNLNSKVFKGFPTYLEQLQSVERRSETMAHLKPPWWQPSGQEQVTENCTEEAPK